jgi:amino acid adenylation domain-containing protein
MPGAEALVVHRVDGPPLRWTHAELDDEVARRAYALRAQGIRRGDAVLLAASRVPALVPALLALLRLGAAYVPFDPAAPEARWRTIADQVNARAVLGSAAHLERAAAVLDPRTLLLDLDAPVPAAGSLGPDVEVTAADTAYVLFTSGSTGTPKGVVVSHGNVLHRVQSYLALTDDPCRYLLHSSLTFDGAVGGMFSTLARGGCLVLVPDAMAGDPARVAAVVREERVTHLEPVPSWWAALLETAEQDDLVSVRVVVLGGEVLPPPLVAATRRALPEVRLFNDYGPTEVTVAATVFEVVPDWTGDDVPIGRPHANTTVALLGADELPVPDGEVGEIWVGGPCVAQGYVGVPEHPSFRVDPLTGGRRYRTGDLARWGTDGQLHFAGRRDRQVKIRGQRIEPEEVETVLLGLPGVGTGAVEVDSAGPETRLVAYAAPLPGAHLDPDVLARLLAKRLPAHLRPGAIVVLPTLPLTSGGKVDRHALPAAPRPTGAGEAPRGEAELAVAEAFSAVLGSPVGRDTNFFAAGGQSLGAARVVARLRRSTGADIGLAELAAAPTPAELAEVLAGSPRVADEKPLTRRPRPAGEVWRVPASPRQESFWYLEFVPGGSGRSNLVEVLSVPEGTSPELLQHAVDALVGRHAALRTAFESTPEGLFQVVLPRVDAPVVALPNAVDARDLDRLADDFGAEPFDLTSAPLLRAGVAHGPEGPALVLVVHHAVADGWSLGLMVEEVAAVLRAGGDARGLPQPEVEYADLVEWIADRPAERRAEAVEELTALLLRSAAAGGSMLPFDRPRPPQPDTRAGLVTFDVPAATLRQVTELSQQLGTTAYSVLAASLGALLARSSGQQEVVLSGPASGRGEPALDRVVGCCINTRLFPVEIGGRPSFAELVRRVAASAAAGERHTWLPLEVPLRPLDEGIRADVAPVLLNLLEFQPADLTVRGGSLGRRSRPSAMAYSELDVYLDQRDGGLAVEVVHSAARLDRSTVEDLCARWLHLLDAGLRNPAQAVDDLPVMTPAEWSRLDRLEGEPGPAPTTTVVDEVRARLAEEPDAVAVVDASGPWTRAEL